MGNGFAMGASFVTNSFAMGASFTIMNSLAMGYAPPPGMALLLGTEMVITLRLQPYRIAVRIQHVKPFVLDNSTNASQWNALFMREYSNAFAR